MKIVLQGLAYAVMALSLLTVCKPPTYSFWKLSILVIEGGHFLIIPCILLGLLCFSRPLWAPWSATLWLCSALLYSGPCIRAIVAAHKLEKQFVTDWGQGSQSLKPWKRPRIISFLDLFRGIQIRDGKFTTLLYHHAPDGDLHLDFYPPKAANKPSACILVIHGGGWDGGSRAQLPALNSFLVQCGYAVASIDYRLAPKYQYPAPVEDVSEALNFLIGRASELGIDPTRFVLLGRSAGGQIALQSAYTIQKAAIKGVISFYAPADMIFGYENPTNPLILNSRQLMEQYLGGKYSEIPDKYRASSPIEQISNYTGTNASKSFPTTLLLHGQADVLVSFQHTVHMEQRMRRDGLKSFIVDIPWGAHGFDFVFRGPGSQISLYYIERFLNIVLN